MFDELIDALRSEAQDMFVILRDVELIKTISILRLFRLPVMFLASIAVAACGGPSFYGEFTSHRESHIIREAVPQKNENPLHFLNVSIKKPRDIEVWYEVSYQTKSPDCMFKEWPFEPFRGEIFDMYKAPKGDEITQIKIPLDRYDSGKCGWHPTSLAHGVFEPSEHPGPSGYRFFLLFSMTGAVSYADGQKCKKIFDSYRKSDQIFCDGKIEQKNKINESRANVFLNYTLDK